MSDLLDMRGAAKRLGVCRDLVSRYVREGLLYVVALPYHKHLRFRPEDVDAFAESCKTLAPSLAPADSGEATETPAKSGPLRRGRKADPNVRHEYGPNWAEEVRARNAH